MTLLECQVRAAKLPELNFLRKAIYPRPAMRRAHVCTLINVLELRCLAYMILTTKLDIQAILQCCKYGRIVNVGSSGLHPHKRKLERKSPWPKH